MTVAALEFAANAVLAYQQHFDVEGDSGIVARAYGTAVHLVSRTALMGEIQREATEMHNSAALGAGAPATFSKSPAPSSKAGASAAEGFPTTRSRRGVESATVGSGAGQGVPQPAAADGAAEAAALGSAEHSLPPLDLNGGGLGHSTCQSMTAAEPVAHLAGQDSFEQGVSLRPPQSARAHTTGAPIGSPQASRAHLSHQTSRHGTGTTWATLPASKGPALRSTSSGFAGAGAGAMAGGFVPAAGYAHDGALSTRARQSAGGGLRRSGVDPRVLPGSGHLRRQAAPSCSLPLSQVQTLAWAAAAGLDEGQVGDAAALLLQARSVRERATMSDARAQLLFLGAGKGLRRHRFVHRLRHADNVQLLTVTALPVTVQYRLGGIVMTRSVKYLGRLRAGTEGQGRRDRWWEELRDEIRAHAAQLRCPQVLGYREAAHIHDDVLVMTAVGTAARLSNASRWTKKRFRRRMQRAMDDLVQSELRVVPRGGASPRHESVPQGGAPVARAPFGKPALAGGSLGATGVAEAQAADDPPRAGATTPEGSSAGAAFGSPPLSLQGRGPAQRGPATQGQDSPATAPGRSNLARGDFTTDAGGQADSRPGDEPAGPPSGSAAGVLGEDMRQAPATSPRMRPHDSLAARGMAADWKQHGHAQAASPHPEPRGKGSSHSVRLSGQPPCSFVHVPLLLAGRRAAFNGMRIFPCRTCCRHWVPETLLSTSEPPRELPVVGSGVFVEARVVRSRRSSTSEVDCERMGKLLMFSDMALIKQLMDRLKLLGCNCAFALRPELVFHADILVSVLSATGYYCEALPPPPLPRVQRSIPAKGAGAFVAEAAFMQLGSASRQALLRAARAAEIGKRARAAANKDIKLRRQRTLLNEQQAIVPRLRRGESGPVPTTILEGSSSPSMRSGSSPALKGASSFSAGHGFSALIEGGGDHRATEGGGGDSPRSAGEAPGASVAESEAAARTAGGVSPVAADPAAARAASPSPVQPYEEDGDDDLAASPGRAMAPTSRRAATIEATESPFRSQAEGARQGDAASASQPADASAPGELKACLLGMEIEEAAWDARVSSDKPGSWLRPFDPAPPALSQAGRKALLLSSSSSSGNERGGAGDGASSSDSDDSGVTTDSGDSRDASERDDSRTYVYEVDDARDEHELAALNERREAPGLRLSTAELAPGKDHLLYSASRTRPFAYLLRFKLDSVAAEGEAAIAAAAARAGVSRDHVGMPTSTNGIGPEPAGTTGAAAVVSALSSLAFGTSAASPADSLSAQAGPAAGASGHPSVLGASPASLAPSGVSTSQVVEACLRRVYGFLCLRARHSAPCTLSCIRTQLDLPDNLTLDVLVTGVLIVDTGRWIEDRSMPFAEADATGVIPWSPPSLVAPAVARFTRKRTVEHNLGAEQAALGSTIAGMSKSCRAQHRAATGVPDEPESSAVAATAESAPTHRSDGESDSAGVAADGARVGPSNPGSEDGYASDNAGTGDEDGAVELAADALSASPAPLGASPAGALAAGGASGELSSLPTLHASEAARRRKRRAVGSSLRQVEVSENASSPTMHGHRPRNPCLPTAEPEPASLLASDLAAAAAWEVAFSSSIDLAAELAVATVGGHASDDASRRAAAAAASARAGQDDAALADARGVARQAAELAAAAVSSGVWDHGASEEAVSEEADAAAAALGPNPPVARTGGSPAGLHRGVSAPAASRGDRAKRALQDAAAPMDALRTAIWRQDSRGVADALSQAMPLAAAGVPDEALEQAGHGSQARVSQAGKGTTFDSSRSAARESGRWGRFGSSLGGPDSGGGGGEVYDPLSCCPGVVLSPMMQVPGCKTKSYLGRLNMHFVRETANVRELGGMPAFLQLLISEAAAVARAQAKALGANAIVGYRVNPRESTDRSRRNQAYHVVSVSGDAVLVTPEVH